MRATGTSSVVMQRVTDQTRVIAQSAQNFRILQIGRSRLRECQDVSKIGFD